MTITDRPTSPEHRDRRMTADEFLSLPPDNSHTQLIDGELVMSDARFRHQEIQVEMVVLLRNWLVDHPGVGKAGIGCNYRMNDYNVFIPDVWFVRQEHIPAGNPLFMEGPPDLAIEVRSPSTWAYDQGRKKDLYLAGGVEELWLVDTVADKVVVCGREAPLEYGNHTSLTTPLIPGLAIDLAALFDR